MLKNFAVEKNFSVTISPADAENLYNNERKLQIFADFDYRCGKLIVAAIYFDTKTLGRIAIAVSLREKISVGSSSMLGLGYGLNIITDYEVKPAQKINPQQKYTPPPGFEDSPAPVINTLRMMEAIFGRRGR